MTTSNRFDPAEMINLGDCLLYDHAGAPLGPLDLPHVQDGDDDLADLSADLFGE